MELRYYQRDALNAIVKTLRDPNGGNPCVEIPTGGGKTPIIANLCGYLVRNGIRVLSVAHRKELIEQTADKLRSWVPDVNYSVVSAGLGKQDYSGEVVVAGIQSVYRNASKILEHGKIGALIVDEAHLIPTTEENANGMYQTLIKDLREFHSGLRIIGLTATPYRMSTGFVCGPDKILTHVCYTASVIELISNGYLSPLISKIPPTSVTKHDFHIERGEFKASEVDETYNQEPVIHEAVSRMVKIGKNRKSALVFCCSVAHCEAVVNALRKNTTERVEMITGETPARDREKFIKLFKGETVSQDLFGNKEKPIKYLCNVDVLTTGFDAPNVDYVILLRPTASPGLFYQMCGRGFRLAEGKTDCLIADFAGNLERFGPIDKIKPPKNKKKGKKEPKLKPCPVCFSAISINARQCPECKTQLKCDDFECPSCGTCNDLRANFCTECGFQFRPIAKHDGTYDTLNKVLSSNPNILRREKLEIKEPVESVQYIEHFSKRSGKNSLRVIYKTPMVTLSEFVCFEHDGFARRKAIEWWEARTEINPPPVSVKQAFLIASSGHLPKPISITYEPKKPNEYAPTIVNVEVEKRPEPVVYSRTDSRLSNFSCDDCGCKSMLYTKEGDKYVITCARCFKEKHVISVETYGTQEKVDKELRNLRMLGIDFVSYETTEVFLDAFIVE